MEKVYMVVPAYNEEENIENLVSSWHSVIEKTGKDSRIVVINDGSKDNTYNILKDLTKKYPRLIALTKENGGHGDTVLYGYKYAIDNKADYIFQTDSDGQTLPSEFNYFWDNRDKYDAIIGNRTNRGDGKSRAFVEKVVCMLLKIIFHVKVPDANAPFRLMKADLVKKYINVMPEHYNLPNIIFTACFKYFNENIMFKEITFRPRQGGVNSINIKKITKIGMQAIHDFRLIKKNIKKMEKNEK